MIGSTFTESIVDEAALDWVDSLGYAVFRGPTIAVAEPSAKHHLIYT